MRNEKVRPSVEVLNNDTKIYLREVREVLGWHLTILSLGGISHDRSRMGLVNDLYLDVIRFLVDDDDFLYSSEEKEERINLWDYFSKKELDLKNGSLKPPQGAFSRKQKGLLTRLRMAVKLGEEQASQGTPYEGSLAGEGMRIAGLMLDPLVDKNKVDFEYEKIRNNRNKGRSYFQKLRIDMDNMLHPLPPDLIPPQE